MLLDKARRVVLTIECKTTLTQKELLGVQSLVFGCVRRKDMNDRESRVTIKRSIPRWVGHDVRGVIEQVQANVIADRKAPKAKKPARKARKR